MRLPVLAVCFLVASFACSIASGEPVVLQQPCANAPPNSNWRCLRIAAPADYARPHKGTVDLNVIVAPASQTRERREPIFVLDGIGESVTQAAPLGLYDSLAQLASTHDLVFVDERGSSGENTLTCPLPSHGPALAPYARSFYAPDYLKSCRNAWKGKTDLTTLSARTFASDVESVRKALRYDKIDLVAYFYGTRIAIDYLRRFGVHAAAVAMTDISPPQVPAIASDVAVSAVGAIVSACGKDAACRALYPDLAREYEDVRAHLAADGLHTVVSHDGVSEEVTIPESAVLSWLGSRSLRVSTQPLVLPAIDSLAKGDGTQTAIDILRYRSDAFERQPFALVVSVQCAEDVPLVDRNAGGAARDLAAACRFWPHERLGRDFRSFFPTPVPVLGVVGEWSAEAPVAAVRALFSHFAHGRLVSVPNRFRATDADWNLCMKPMITKFLDHPDPGIIDTGCLADIDSIHLAVETRKAGQK